MSFASGWPLSYLKVLIHIYHDRYFPLQAGSKLRYREDCATRAAIWPLKALHPPFVGTYSEHTIIKKASAESEQFHSVQKRPFGLDLCFHPLLASNVQKSAASPDPSIHPCVRGISKTSCFIAAQNTRLSTVMQREQFFICTNTINAAHSIWAGSTAPS